MSAPSMVVLGLSIATVVLLLGAFVATMRQDRRGRAGAPEESAPAAPAPVPAPVASFVDPRTFRVGDRIEVHGAPWRLLGAMHVSWQGQQWTEYLIEDTLRRRQWLSVKVRHGLASGDPPHLEVLIWTEVPTQGMVPAKSMLIMEGVEFFPIERGTAAFRSEGETGRPDRGLMDFADYRAADGRLLSFVRVQGGPWTASYAHPLPPGSVSLIDSAS
ncbi:DUF4178 domain-containing protein [Nonomuraea sp. NPDC050310]|uniref:DUF4178 domain-containing protein n=1 Tax=unclassified Nonomuraea TaxID=2593643 RepID=UPI0034106893